MSDLPTPAGPIVGRNCFDCEFYDLRKHPGAGFLASRKPFCAGLGFYLFGNHATDCDLAALRAEMSGLLRKLVWGVVVLGLALGGKDVLEAVFG